MKKDRQSGGAAGPAVCLKMESGGPKQKALTNTLRSAISSRRSSLIDSDNQKVEDDDSIVHNQRDFDAKKFEAKKRKIAQRLKAEEDLEALRC